MQPAQRLLSCLFCLLSQGRESHRERERERREGEDCCKSHVWKTIFYSSISKRQTRTHFVALKPETGLLTVKKGGMLVLQISDPCLAAKPKQIPFQAAHLRGSSLSPLLSRLKARDIWRGVFKCKIQTFSVIGIHSAFVREWKTRQLYHKYVASRETSWKCGFLSPEQIPVSYTCYLLRRSYFR